MPQGTVMAASGRAQPKPGFKVRLEPVMQAVATAGDRRRAAYVMGDDPEHMNIDAVIAARPLRHSVIRRDADDGGLPLPGEPAAGAGRGPRRRWCAARSPGSAMSGLFVLIVVLTAAAAWIVITVTRPLRDLSDAVARAQRDGFDGAAIGRPPAAAQQAGRATNSRSCAPASTPCWRGCARSGMRCAGSTSSAARASATCRTTCARR